MSHWCRQRTVTFVSTIHKIWLLYRGSIRASPCWGWALLFVALRHLGNCDHFRRKRPQLSNIQRGKQRFTVVFSRFSPICTLFYRADNVHFWLGIRFGTVRLWKVQYHSKRFEGQHREDFSSLPCSGAINDAEQSWLRLRGPREESNRNRVRNSE